MRILNIIVTTTLALLAFSCTNTMIKTAWHNPEVKALTYRKVLALAIADQATHRRVMEDTLVADIASVGQVQSVAAHSVLADADIKDEAKIKAAIAKVGADGLVVMRMVGSSQEKTYVKGQVFHAPVVHRTWWGYYRTVVPVSYTPGYYRTDEKVRLETMVFSVADEKLVWAGTSETMNPSSITELTREVAAAVVKDMGTRGLLR